MSNCAHTKTNDIDTHGYTGPVAAPGHENRAAHGNVQITVECVACGARRSELHNGRHVELGPWGPSRAQREALAQRLRRSIPDRPEPIKLYNQSTGQECLVVCDDEGMVFGMPDAAAHALAGTAWLERACAYRRAYLRWQRGLADDS